MPPAKRLITADDLYRFKLLFDVQISPDGAHVIYVLQHIDRDTEKKFSNLWIVPTEGGEARQFTFGDHRDTSPRWSPDGKQIAFLSDRQNPEKEPQVHVIPFSGGEARRLTFIAGEVSNLSWSPRGKRLLCNVRKTDPEVLERESDPLKKKLGVVARHYDRAFYKLDGYGYLPKERTHIWTIDVRTGRNKQLTDHEVWDELSPTFSPDGKWIVFLSNRTPDPDLDLDAIDLFVMPSRGGEIRLIETPPGPKTLPAVSPDGKWIAYIGQQGKGKGYRNAGVRIVPFEGDQKARNLTNKYDLHAGSHTATDLYEDVEDMPPVWSADSQRLYFQALYHGSTLLKSVSIKGDDLRDLVGEGGVVGSFSLDRGQEKVAYFFGQFGDICQVYVREVSAGRTRHLTRINRDILERIELPKIEEVWFKGPDDNDLQGWIVKPPDFDGRKRYPSILYIHGGPLLQYGKFFFHEFYFLAAQGYVVYFTNPRGGRGYGEAHAKSIWGAWGTRDYADLMAWADHMQAQNYIDPKRMGVTGGSYGGYMTVWIIGHTERFSAAVAARCVSNFISEWGSADYNWTFEYEVEAGPPFRDIRKWWDMSPIKYIGSASTPTLVLHSENDLRCPIEQGEQVFVALKRLGVDSEFVRFPDEFHGLSRTGRTDRRIVRLNHITRWFDRYLKK